MSIQALSRYLYGFQLFDTRMRKLNFSNAMY